MLKTEQNDVMTEALQREGEKIAGLNIQKGLETMSRDAGAWLDVIRVFADTMPSLLLTLNDTGSANRSLYTVTVHGIKGACFGIGAEQAGKLAQSLEEGSRAGDDRFVLENNGRFIALVEKLIEDLKALLAIFSTQNTKPLTERPDPALLTKILEAAQTYDIRGLEDGAAILEKNSYREEPDMASWLRAQILVSNFEAIAKRLAKIKK